VPTSNNLSFAGRVAGMLLLLGMAASHSPAQTASATVTGSVTDTTGAAVANCNVVLHNAGTGVDRNAVTNASGAYNFPDVLPGRYTLSAEATGFSRKQVEEFALEVNQTATFNLTLDIGQVNQTVEVQAQAAQIERATAELGGVVTEKQVVDLPLNGRNFTQLLALQPGASPVSVAQNGGGNGGLRAAINPSINGQLNRSNLFLLDGMVDEAPLNNSYAIPPIVDTIQEFKIQSHNDQAEYGQVLGGIVNVATRSGTNQLHGTGWEYVRNNDFDARQFNLPQVLPYRFNQFGGVLGGPVVLPKIYNGHNKTFFMIAYEGDRLHQPSSSFYRVPTAANYAGDFSDWPEAIYNPYTTTPDPAKPGQFKRTPYAGNQVPVSQFSPQMVYYAKTLLPAPVATGQSGYNALDTDPTIDSVNSYQARVDHNFSNNKDFAFFRWTGRIDDQTSSGGIANLTSSTYTNTRSYAISETHTFSPTMVATFQGGRIWAPSQSTSYYNNLPSNFFQTMGFSSLLASPYVLNNRSMVPGLLPTGYWPGPAGGGYESANGAQTLDDRQFKGDFTKVIGKHTIKFGAEADIMEFLNGNASVHLSFLGTQTANPENQAKTGDPLTSFFLDLPADMTQRNNLASFRNGWIASGYIEDQWKVTPKLTVNIGLRYDRVGFPSFGNAQDKTEYIGNLDLGNGTYRVQNVPGPCATLNAAPCIPTADGSLPTHVSQGPLMNDYAPKNFGPRVGFAYQIGPNTVIRSAFGIFYDNWAGLTQTAQNTQGTWPSTGQLLLANLNVPSTTQLTPNTTALDPLAGSSAHALWPAATPFNQVQWYFDPNLKDPYSMQWNFGIQHQLSASTVVSANYVGSGSRRVDIGTFYNTALTPGPGNPQARSLFPYAGATYWDRSWNNSNYQALQVSVDRRFAGGFAYTLAYTRSKAIDVGCSGYYGTEGCSSQDAYNTSLDRSVAGFDIPNLFSFSWVYEVPFGKNKLSTGHSVLDYIIGNWQVNGITALRSGQPYSVTLTGDSANIGDSKTYLRPNLVGNTTPANLTPSQWILASGFAAPPAFTFGDLGRNTFRSDWGKDVDLSLFRQFPIKEWMTLEFRAEAFNVFNVTTFGLPDSNLSDANFGKVTTLAQTPPRELQFSVKIRF
jgi:hypothetical protein